MGRKDKSSSAPPKSKLEVRADIISYIRNERDTVLKKWMALQESVKAEDRRREAFAQERLERETTILPLTIRKMIGSLKKAVRAEMRYKGGTALSIIRNMFIYWDADKSGEISAKELEGAMTSLGVIMTAAEREEVVAYYDSGKGQNEMSYARLLKDIERGEPSILAFVDKKEEDARTETEARFDEVADKYRELPPRVRQFVEATQNYVAGKLKYEGGTPEHHVRHLFTWFDYDYSGGLNPSELCIAASKGMNLKMEEADALAVIDHFDRHGRHELVYDEFIKEVVAVVKPVLHHTELTKEAWNNEKKALAQNPFIRRPWRAPRNRILTKFKHEIMEKCLFKVKSQGGSVRSWIKEAIIFWDNLCERKFKRTEQLIGFAKRLGVTISEDDAQVIMRCYDRFGNGEMLYPIFVEEMEHLDPHFLSDAPTDYSRTTVPDKAHSLVDRIKRCAEKFSQKSRGVVCPRDVLHGTFLPFDQSGKGRIGARELKLVCQELKVPSPSATEMEQVVTWYDTNGSGLMEYGTFITDLFGEDIASKTLTLPQLGGDGTSTVSMTSTKAFGADTVKLTTQAPPVDTTGFTSTQIKNLRPVESKATKVNRQQALRRAVLAERAAVLQKLESIENQQKYIVNDYNERHPKVKW